MEKNLLNNSEYIPPYKNPYIEHQKSKKDLRWTRKKKRRYSLISKLGNLKLFSTSKIKKVRNPFNWVLEKCKKKFNYDFFEWEFAHTFEREHYSEKDNITTSIDLKYIYIYDIMPKEDLDEFREGFINYSDICKHNIGVADDDSINKAFENMLNHNYRFSTGGLRYFIIDEKMTSFKWIENIYVSFQQYGESFYLISLVID